MDLNRLSGEKRFQRYVPSMPSIAKRLSAADLFEYCRLILSIARMIRYGHRTHASKTGKRQRRARPAARNGQINAACDVTK
jgi:hypothetical protein